MDQLIGVYLCNYGRTAQQPLGFCRICHKVLRTLGQLLNRNKNVLNFLGGPASFRKYGIERTRQRLLPEGYIMRWYLLNDDGRNIKFLNFYMSPETHAEAFERAEFWEFLWMEVSLDSSKADNPRRDDLVAHPSILA